MARVVGCALVAVVSTITSVYALSYATGPVGLDKATVLAVGVVANVVALGAIPLWAALADRIGRKPVFIGGALGSGALTFAYLGAISSGNYALIFVIGIALVGVVYSAANGVWPSLYGEMFSTRVRCSGMAIGTQIGFALGGFAPTIATALAGPGAGDWVPVAVFTAVCTVIAAGCALSTRETYRVPMHELGAKRDHAPALSWPPRDGPRAPRRRPRRRRDRALAEPRPARARGRRPRPGLLLPTVRHHPARHGAGRGRRDRRASPSGRASPG